MLTRYTGETEELFTEDGSVCGYRTTISVDNEKYSDHKEFCEILHKVIVAFVESRGGVMHQYLFDGEVPQPARSIRIHEGNPDA
jgi:hypothetical protein